MRAIENILFHEWIGLNIKISESSQTSLKNISGKIIFETKNMLIVRTLNNGIKKKKNSKKNYFTMYSVSSLNSLLYKG
jgi:RNase P/RNase MRP subunit p29